MNRVSVCEAYWLYYAHYQSAGLTRRCLVHHGIAAQLDRLRFRPSPLLSFDSLRRDDHEEARDAYLALVRKWEGNEQADFTADNLKGGEA